MDINNLGWIMLVVFAGLVVICLVGACNYWRKVYWSRASIKKRDLGAIELTQGWDDYYTVGCASLSYGDRTLFHNFVHFDTGNALEAVLVGPDVIGQTIGNLSGTPAFTSYESDNVGGIATEQTRLTRRRKERFDTKQYNEDPYRVKSLLLTIYGTGPDGTRIKRTGNVKVLFDDENVHGSKHERNGIILNKNTLKRFGVIVRCNEEYIDFSEYYNKLSVTQARYTKDEFIHDFKYCNGILTSKHYKFLASDSPSIDPKISIAVKCE